MTSGEAILLSVPQLDLVNYEVEIKFPTGSSTNKAGLIFGHDGDDDYYALVLDRSVDRIRLHKITGGSWGAALAEEDVTINDSTAYVIKAVVKQEMIDCYMVGESISVVHYPSSPVPMGHGGLYSNKTDVEFDDFKAFDASVRDPQTPRTGGLAATSLSSNQLLVESDPDSKRGGEVAVGGFHDDFFILQVDVSSYMNADVWVRYVDPNNGYRIRLKGTSHVAVQRILNGNLTTIASSYLSPLPTIPVTLKIRVYDDSGTDKIAVYTDGTLQVTASDSWIPAGGVAFSGTGSPVYDDAKIGYDNSDPPDADIDDAGDDIIWDENFGSSSVTASHDHAGNLIDDGVYRYVYDAWNRLVKVQSSEDSGATTIQTAEFDATGRRMMKVVTDSGDYDGTVVYLYGGLRKGTMSQIIETRDGSGNLAQQFIHGAQYIDELVMMRVKDKGDLYVHQDANWNVIGLTDLGGSLVERYVNTPYGITTVHQETGYGDRDGDGDVDATGRAAIETGGACLGGSPPGECRVLDLDFDGDYDADDREKFDALPQGLMRHPGRIATNVDQPFGHQGLLSEPEIGSYQNRARQYNPTKRRFNQRDPVSLGSRVDYAFQGCSLYLYVEANPVLNRDSSGELIENIPFILGLVRCAMNLADIIKEIDDRMFSDAAYLDSQPPGEQTECGTEIWGPPFTLAPESPRQGVPFDPDGDGVPEPGSYWIEDWWFSPISPPQPPTCPACPLVGVIITHGNDWPCQPPNLPSEQEVEMICDFPEPKGGVIQDSTTGAFTIVTCPYTGSSCVR